MGREIPCVEATPMRPRSSSNNCRDLGVNRRLRSRAWSLRRTAAPAGRWLYLGTNCPARRSTASLVKTRRGRDDAEFFMRSLDYARIVVPYLVGTSQEYAGNQEADSKQLRLALASMEALDCLAESLRRGEKPVLNPGLNPISAKLCGASMGEWLLSRRDRLIVASTKCLGSAMPRRG